MVDPSLYRPKNVPELPGVYRFKTQDDSVIYVGKAKNLKNRLNSYFTDITNLHPRTAMMVKTAAKVDWVTVHNEVEALQLEFTWIKAFNPRFNVRFRDNKTYPYLTLTLKEEFPQIAVTRGAKKKGNKYYGPFTHVWAIRQTMEQIIKVFPIRSCKDSVFRRHQLMKRPCLLGDIERCAAPCVARVDKNEYSQIVNNVLNFLNGNTKTIFNDLNYEMQKASQNEEYEKAARYRDRLEALNKVVELNAIVFDDETDADLIALAADELHLSIQIFHVRQGQIKGERSFVSDRIDHKELPDHFEDLLTQIYGELEGDAIPKEILTNHELSNLENVTKWISENAKKSVDIRRPQRGDKKKLMETSEKNAEQNLISHKLKRSADLLARTKALEELAQALELEQAPLRIECIDISNISGTSTTASLVVFEDAIAQKKHYRTFNIKSFEGQDDPRAIAEVVSRRYRYLIDGEDAENSNKKSFAYRPSLVLIDGGIAQVNAARNALDELGLSEIETVGIAKRLEELWKPGAKDPIILPRNSEALFLVQRIRDEAHRFAVTKTRQRHSKKSLESELDVIPGLGEKKIKFLLDKYGSVSKIRKLDIKELAQNPGFNEKLATAILDGLQAETPSFDVETGEILS
ncbi:MAG: excinuclease ABC subunit UvrC [Candidatus Nanopelagicales bacterium]